MTLTISFDYTRMLQGAYMYVGAVVAVLYFRILHKCVFCVWIKIHIHFNYLIWSHTHAANWSHVVCRSGGGWCGWTEDATLLSVWWHGEHSQSHGKHWRRYVILNWLSLPFHWYQQCMLPYILKHFCAWSFPVPLSVQVRININALSPAITYSRKNSTLHTSIVSAGTRAT